MLSSENLFSTNVLNPDTFEEIILPNNPSLYTIQESLSTTDEKAEDLTFSPETNFVPLSDMLYADIESANQAVQSLLSASEAFRMQFFDSLTSVPLHPYERLKYDCFGKEFKPLTLNEVEVSEGFSCVAAVQEISAISDKFHDITDVQVRALTCDDLPNECNAFAILSGNQFVIEKDKLSKHVNFLEFVKNIPISVIEANPIMVAQKITHQYIKAYQ
jgi:hypothetical protein